MESWDSIFSHSDKVHGITTLKAHNNKHSASVSRSCSTNGKSNAEPDQSDDESVSSLQVMSDNPKRLINSPSIKVDNIPNGGRGRLSHEVDKDSVYYLQPRSLDRFLWDLNPEVRRSMRLLRPVNVLLEQVVLPRQCAQVEECVGNGWHLAALASATMHSCETTFEGDYQDVFESDIHVFHLGEEDEAPGVFLRFRTRLPLELKQYIGRLLLRGIVMRYPRRSFPRTFWVTEGNEDPIILQINNAVDTRAKVYELGRAVHHAIVRQWKESQDSEGV